MISLHDKWIGNSRNQAADGDCVDGLPEVQGLLMNNGMSVERMVEILYHHNLGSRFQEMQVQGLWELWGLMDTFSPFSLIYGDEEVRVFRPQALF